MSHSIKDLFNLYDDQPILVIGGGPSVRQDLPKLIELGVVPRCVISANSHGTLQKLFPVDYIVHVDKRHAGLKVWMVDHLRPFGIPLISKHSFADFRLPEYSFQGNSGLTAVHVAASLGGNPVIVTGLDMWTSGRNYFHDADASDRKQRMPRPASDAVRPAWYAEQRALELRKNAGGVRIRPVSGPFTHFFPAYDVDEPFRKSLPCEYRKRLEGLDVRQYRAERGYQFSSGDRCAEGNIVSMSNEEAKGKPVILV